MENSTVFCTNCGAKINASYKVCFSCGTKNKQYRPAESPVEPAAKAPVKTAAEIPAEAATKAPVEPTAKAPVKTAAELPAEAATKVPVEPTAEVPIFATAKFPAVTAAKVPEVISASPKALRKKPKKSKKGLIIVLIAGVVAVIALVAIILILTLNVGGSESDGGSESGGYEGVIDDIGTFENSRNVNDLKKLIPDDAAQYCAQQYFNGDEAALWSYVDEKLYIDRSMGYSYSYEIISADELSTLELNEYCAAMEADFGSYGMDVYRVSEAHSIDAERMISGADEETNSRSFSITIFKYDGDWRCLEAVDMIYYILN